LTNDRSGITGSTVFDFDGDGSFEVVYRDETDLRILDGRTGAILYKTPCRSGTRWEYPVVADVNNNGLTNLICSCSDIGLTAFGSANIPWVPARAVWNQHGYNVTNVNDDLTIPYVPANNLTSAGSAFNNFLVQSTVLDNTGDPVPNADADAIILDIALDNSNCPTSTTLNVTVANIGDDYLSPSTKITVYSGDPTLSAVSVLHTRTIDSLIEANGDVDITMTFDNCPTGNLFVVVNLSLIHI